jgi:hypothetical protein
MNAGRLAELAAAWRRHFIARDALLFAGGVAMAAGIAALWLPFDRLLMIIVAVSAVAFIYRAVLRPPRLSPAMLARHLDRTYPELEESSALWLQVPDALTVVEQLQRQRIDAAAQRLSTAAGASFAAPDRAMLRRAAVCAMAGLIVCAALVGWSASQRRAIERTEEAQASPSETPVVPASNVAPVSPKIVRAEMLVRPPAYTGRAERRIDGLNVEIEEGSSVTWTFALDQNVQQARVTFGGGNAVTLNGDGTSLSGTHVVAETKLYQLEATLPNGAVWSPPEIYSLKVIKDRAPSVKVAQPVAARTELAPAPRCACSST